MSCQRHESILTRVTLQDLADALGLAKSTVARALNGRGRVAESTRRRVQELAGKMGYRPDPGLSMIAASRWKRASSGKHWTLGMLWSRPLDEAVRDRLQMWVGAMGCALDFLYLPAFDSARALARVLEARGWRGVLIGPLPRPDLAALLEIDWRSYSVLCCGLGRVRLPFDVVQFNQFGNTRMAWQRLQEMGARRIAPFILRHEPKAEDDVGREAAVRYEMGRIPVRQRLPITWLRSADATGLADWVRGKKADGLLLFPLSLGWQLKREGIPIPGEVKMVALQMTRPENCPGMLCDPESLVGEAIELLVTKLRAGICGPPAQPKEVLLPGQWVEPAMAEPAESGQ